MASLYVTTTNLAAAQTPEVFQDSPLRVLSATFTAGPANTGTIYVGTELLKPNANGTPPIGQPIIPGQVMTITPSDFTQSTGLPHTFLLSTIWMDGDVQDDDLVCFALIE